MRGETSVDTVVVGAGIVGAAAAYQLARRGRSVLICEQFELDHVYGSSHGRSRIFRLAYDQPDYTRLAQMALPLWRELEREAKAELLVTVGGLDLGPREVLEPIAETLADAGASYEWLDRQQLSKRFEWVHTPDEWVGILQPDGGVLRARRAVKTLIELAKQHGAQVCENTRAVGIVRMRDGAGVETDEGAFYAGQVVVAAGAWANDLLDSVELHVPITVTREHVAYYARNEADSVVPFIWHPGGDGTEYYGLPNLREETVKLGQHGGGPEVNPTEDGNLDPERIRALDEFVSANLHGVRNHPEMAETCLYASTPDDDFVIDRVGPVILAVGFGGHGFKFGPSVGALVADLVEGRSIPFSGRFSRSRFEERVLQGANAG
ncbi:MAG TPA: N-methyl-L-tryptophan oxidase [Chloroflexota bacterium]|nr:N-methyl-L-tryptophan oxidase [Chloroflexota bacterium]